MDLGEKTNIQKQKLVALDSEYPRSAVSVNLHPPAQHQSIPKDTGMGFTAIPRASQGWQCLCLTEQYQGHQAAMPQAGDHSQNAGCMTIFPTFAALTVTFTEILQLQRDPYLSWQSENIF